MENTNYIPLEQDLINLSNKFKSIEGLIDFEAFKTYGRYAYMYDKHYTGYDKKRSRMIVRKTMRNAYRMYIAITKKMIGVNDINLWLTVSTLSNKLIRYQLMMS